MLKLTPVKYGIILKHPTCYGNYMNCGFCSEYAVCKSKKLKNGNELRKICTVCENCALSRRCARKTLYSLRLQLLKG